MTSERDLLFALTRQRFTPAHQARVEAICRGFRIDWELVARMAGAEGVAPIVGANLAACDPARTSVPDAITEMLQHALFENVALKVERRREFTDQLVLLDAHGYDVLLLKSVSLEVVGVYAQPWVTCARDVDVLLRPRAARQDGPDDAPFRQALNQCGVENDKDFSKHHDLSLNGIVNVPFDDMWRAARPVQMDGVPTGTAYVMCPEDQLLASCLNSCRKRYFRLKALFDIAETLEHYGDLDWGFFAQRVRTSGAEGVVFTALRAADETLGIPAAAGRWYSALLSRRRAVVLGAIVTLLHRSRSPLARTALQYASFSQQQRWRSVKLSARNRLPRRSASERAQAHLPGEQAAVESLSPGAPRCVPADPSPRSLSSSDRSPVS
jgi:hypothetical protein